jgi:competence protein ComEC
MPTRRAALFLLALLALLTACGYPPLTAERVAPPSSPAAARVSQKPTAAPARPLPALPDGQLRVHFIDVGQGDSILLQTSDGQSLLIDGGYGGSGALAYLQAHGITSIDVMVATHPHADHIGGLVDVLRALPVGAVWTSGASHSTGTFEDFLDAIADARVPYHEARPGDRIMVGQLAALVLLSQSSARELNDASLVLHLQLGQVAFLFTGDAERPSEERLLREQAGQLPATVLKVGHHGSATSSSPAFLAAVHPQLAVYSAGRGNSYGHPHAQTIAQLEVIGAQIYGTDQLGTIVIATDGTALQVFPERGEVADVALTPIPAPAEPPPMPAGPTPAPTSPPAARPTLPPPPARAAPTPAPELRYDPRGPDRDGGDFATHAEAQAFFVAAGGRPEIRTGSTATTTA